MNTLAKAQPVYRDEDKELVGYILKRGEEWLPLTIFGYPLTTATPSYEDAVRTVNLRGLASLAEVWQYYDEEELGWFNCSIIEVANDSLTLRITDYDHPRSHETFKLQSPSVRTLRKAN